MDQVVEKLRQYNPGFEGEIESYQFKDDQVVTIEITQEPALVDISPFRALPHLTKLVCRSTGVADLSGLAGLPLEHLNLGGNGRLSDLSPLKGMPLTFLHFMGASVQDLSPLAGMPLEILYCTGSKVSDLSPLNGMPLTLLGCAQTRIVDLTPLKDMRLTHLAFWGTSVHDLTPLAGMPLTSLDCHATRVSDFSPLRGMPLEKIWFTPRLFDGQQEEVLKSLPLRRINGPFPGGTAADEYWKDLAEQRKSALAFQKEAAALLPAQQVEAVADRLKKLNAVALPELETVVSGDAVVEAKLTGSASDLTPLMAFTKLEKLTLGRWNQYPDCSPLASLPLKELSCGPWFVLANSEGLAECETLETINGEPVAAYLAKLPLPKSSPPP